MKYNKSLKLLNSAKSIIPTASQTYSKSYRYYCEGAAPVYLDYGKGSHVWDVDGNEFVDFVLALGAVTLGYNQPEINTAINRQLKKGISFSQPHPLEVELAEKLVEIIPCAEMVRFLKNGSDATTAAIRLARAYTGRETVACCGYHGFHDWYIASTMNNGGIPKVVCDLVEKFEYNNIDSLTALFKRYPEQIAAIIMEPVILDPPEKDFLHKVKDIASTNGSVLIFDEVLTGFRVSLGGAQELYNIVPDIAAFGKGIANGMPLSFVTGKQDIMCLIDEDVFISTTFGGETLSLAAALATISVLEREEYVRYIWSLGGKWLKEVSELIKKKGLSSIMRTAGLAPHSGVIFNDAEGVLASDWLSLYQQELLAEGILSIGINNYCLDHTSEDLEKYFYAIEKALDKIVLAMGKGEVNSFLLGEKIKPIFKRN